MKLVRNVLVGAVTLGLAGTAMAAETYLKAENTMATDPWELSGDTLRGRPGTERNDNPVEGAGTIRFRVPAGEVSADLPQYFSLRYRSTDYGKDSVYTASEDGTFVKHDLPIGDDFQWFNTEISKSSTNDGSVEYVVAYREAGAEIKGMFVSDDPEAVPSTTGGGGAEPAPPPTNPDPVITPPTGEVSGVRYYNSIGTKNWKRLAFNEPKANWAITAYNQYIKDAVSEYPCAFSKHHPSIATRVLWHEAYVDSNLKPTRAQARDPNWSNYVWNRKGSPGDGAVWDGITAALSSPMIDNGKGNAKLLIGVALSMSGNHNAPPLWMRKDASLTWNEGEDNANRVGEPWHVRFDNSVAVDHASWFMEALLKKYGNNSGIHSISLSESYFGKKASWPSGLDLEEYLKGIRGLWNRTSKAAPRDSDGRRVNLMQVSPLFDKNVSMEDLKNAGFGMAASDTYIQLPLGVYSKTFADGYKNGIYTTLMGDSRFACRNRPQHWGESIPNPFGHKKGYSGIATPQELFWWHGEKGKVPMNSIFMSLSPYCTSVQVEENWLDGIKRFGRCGTQGKWGLSPAGSSKANTEKDLSCSTEGDVQVFTNEDGSVNQKVCLLKVLKNGDEALQLQDF